jgi:acyl-CoA thioester hydrolase
LLTTGVSFADLHQRGIDVVVSKITMTFKVPLRSGDEFISKLYLQREGIRFVFYQDIFRKSDNKLCLRGVVDAVCVENGVLTRGEMFDELFANYL